MGAKNKLLLIGKGTNRRLALRGGTAGKRIDGNDTGTTEKSDSTRGAGRKKGPPGTFLGVGLHPDAQRAREKGAPSRQGGRLQHQVPQEFLAAHLVILFVHIDQEFDGLVAHGLLERVCDEDALQRLQQGAVDVVAPEGIQVRQLRELDVADDGAQVPRLQDRVGLAETFKLALQGVLLVGEDVALQGRLVLAVLGPDSEADICRCGWRVERDTGGSVKRQSGWEEQAKPRLKISVFLKKKKKEKEEGAVLLLADP
ncbi:hypothetical protein E2320_013732 [Naja naja]|nr:hypothetical protein E2320_013732 [Naja naja]